MSAVALEGLMIMRATGVSRSPKTSIFKKRFKNKITKVPVFSRSLLMSELSRELWLTTTRAGPESPS